MTFISVLDRGPQQVMVHVSAEADRDQYGHLEITIGPVVSTWTHKPIEITPEEAAKLRNEAAERYL